MHPQIDEESMVKLSELLSSGNPFLRIPLLPVKRRIRNVTQVGHHFGKPPFSMGILPAVSKEKLLSLNQF